MATTTDLEKLVINYLTQDQYDDAREAGTLNANELYLTPDTGSTGGTVTSIATGDGLTGGPITTSGTISHADTSSQSSVSNSGRTYIQSVTLDTYGHVTGLSSATETVTNSDEKLGTDAVTSGTTYYIVAGTNTTGAERKKYDASGIAYKATNGTANGTNGEALLTLGNSTASTSANWKAGKIFLYSSSAYGGTLVPEAVTSSSKTWTLPNKTGTIALTSDIPDTSSFITVDEKLKWTASTTSSTYYPIQSTSTAATSTANTLNSVSFYQYYNTAGGYRRFILGNTTAYTSSGGAYGTIRLYGTGATYYGDLNPGTIGANSLTANRTWTLPDKTGTIALTSDIPTKTSELTNDSGFITASHTSTYSLPLAASGTRGGVQIGYSESGTNYAVKLSSEKMYVTVPWTDTKVTTAALTSGTTYYPILATGTGTATRQIDSTLGGLKYISTAGSTSAVGTAILHLGNSTASGSSNNEQGVLRMYTINTRYVDIKTESTFTPTGSRIIYLPSYDATMYLTCTNTTDAVGGATTAPVYVDNTGRIQAVTSIPYTLLSGTPTIPTVPSSTGSSTTGITASTTATKTTLGTAGSVTGVQSSTTTASKVTVGSHSTDYGVKTAGSGDASLTFTMDTTDTKQLNITFSHTHTAPTLGSKIPTVSASDVIVPIKNTSSTSIPNVSVTSATVTISDPKHSHTI